MIYIMGQSLSTRDIARTYLREKRHAFETLRLEYRHNCLYNRVVVRGQRLVAQYSKEGVDDRCLIVIVRYSHYRLGRKRHLVDSADRFLARSVIIWTTLEMEREH